MKSFRRRALAISLVLFSASISPAARAAAAPSADKWFMILIADVPVGYIHDTPSRKPGPGGDILVYASDMRMVLNRLGTKVEMRFLTVSEETSDGRLIRETYEMQASQTSTRTEAAVKDGRIEFRSEAGGKTYDRTIPYAGTLLGEEGIRLLSKTRLHAPGDAIEFQTFSPEIEGVARGTRRFLAAETIAIEGQPLPAIKVEETIESAGVKSTGWLDGNHEMVRQDMPTPFGQGVFVLTSRAAALKSVEGGELPPELFEKSMVRANVRIPQARSLAALRVRLKARDGNAAWPDFKGPGLAVLSTDGAAITLELRRRPAPAPASFPVVETSALAEYLRPNAYVESDQADVEKLARAVIGGETDLFKAVLKLGRWVAENMTFDLGIALAPSSEIFAHRRGTCLGYATFLATLARAAGIPSRVVMGYAYVLGVFGGHAWTEVRVGEEWVPVDAALPSDGPADAGRIPLGASSFAEGSGLFSAAPGFQLLGRIDIRIVGYTGADGRNVSVPDDAVPFRSDGGYDNPWLGVALAVPPGFKLGGTDAVWPSPVVAVLEGGGGARAELQEHYLPPWRQGADAAADVFRQMKIEGTPSERNVGPLGGFQAESMNRTALVLIDRGEAWALVVEGRGSAGLLDRIAAGLKFVGR